GVTDAFDANTTFVSADNGGAQSGSQIVWTGLTVPAQVGSTPGTLVLTVEVTVNDPIPAGVTTIANLAYETGTTPPDCTATPTDPRCVTTPTSPQVTMV
ncbi:hypothetical protein, partial [Ciceribacter sp. RN22]|uniref:hypothetical protein n=1 Tax=Ciceribacter sp. RN22 TaxID=2954932 RepID=UPI002093A199